MAAEIQNGKGSSKKAVTRTVILHPFLFPLWFIFSLFSTSQLPLNPQWILRPTVCVLLSAAFVWLVFWAAVRNPYKAGVLCTALLCGICLYGPLIRRPGHSVCTLLGLSDSAGLFAGVTLFAIGLLLMARWQGEFRQFTSICNRIGILTLSLAIFNFFLSGTFSRDFKYFQRISRPALEVSETPKPDIYFIVLDAYARADTLSKLYGYDNSHFLDAFKSKGFFVAQQSRSNYTYTLLSLASCLNIDYLDCLTPQYGTDSKYYYEPLVQLLNRCRVIQYLKTRGYAVFNFDTGYEDMSMVADVNLKTLLVLNRFENMLLHATAIGLLLHRLNVYPDALQHAARIRFTFSQLGELSKTESRQPRFVFAHVISPHPPFVAWRTPQRDLAAHNADYHGFSGGPAKYHEGYIAQLRAINKLAESAVTTILQRASAPPIIIVVSDHGPGSGLDLESFEKTDLQERMSNLIMVYLPGHKKHTLYHSMTLVNLFRIVFNDTFGAHFSRLKDVSYYSTLSHPYRMREVPIADPRSSPR